MGPNMGARVTNGPNMGRVRHMGQNGFCVRTPASSPSQKKKAPASSTSSLCGGSRSIGARSSSASRGAGVGASSVAESGDRLQVGPPRAPPTPPRPPVAPSAVCAAIARSLWYRGPASRRRSAASRTRCLSGTCVAAASAAKAFARVPALSRHTRGADAPSSIASTVSKAQAVWSAADSMSGAPHPPAISEAPLALPLLSLSPPPADLVALSVAAPSVAAPFVVAPFVVAPFVAPAMHISIAPRPLALVACGSAPAWRRMRTVDGLPANAPSSSAVSPSSVAAHSARSVSAAASSIDSTSTASPRDDARRRAFQPRVGGAGWAPAARS